MVYNGGFFSMDISGFGITRNTREFELSDGDWRIEMTNEGPGRVKFRIKEKKDGLGWRKIFGREKLDKDEELNEKLYNFISKRKKKNVDDLLEAFIKKYPTYKKYKGKVYEKICHIKVDLLD